MEGHAIIPLAAHLRGLRLDADSQEGRAPVDVQQVVAWLRRLVNLDMRVFDEIRTNPTATIPGATVAFVSILIAGFGGWLWWGL